MDVAGRGGWGSVLAALTMLARRAAARTGTGLSQKGPASRTIAVVSTGRSSGLTWQ